MLKFDDRIATLTFPLHTSTCRCGCNTAQLIDPIFLCDDNANEPPPTWLQAK